jgi:hypothetical protein
MAEILEFKKRNPNPVLMQYRGMGNHSRKEHAHSAKQRVGIIRETCTVHKRKYAAAIRDSALSAR